MRFIFFALISFAFEVFAQGVPSTNALSFAPPANDSSLLFLSNIFGVVDGILAGTGSQIFARMMSVFNSAVLALGSIVFTYILILGTMQTAHEGEFLGRRWSSIMIPLRTTFGLALLIPKASGYCIIQIFVVWVVVQGVGAADKIWGAALDYLNQGGKIVQEQLASSNVSSGGTSTAQTTNPVYVGGIAILSGQVCMYGLEQILKKLQSTYKAMPNGPCSSGNALMKEFCTSAVPDFLGSVDAVSFQQNNPTVPVYKIPMPNFSVGNNINYGPYGFLSGICGKIVFNSAKAAQSSSNSGTFSNLSSSQLDFATQTRAVAVQTMYSFLANVAYTMVNNVAILSDRPSSTTETVAADWASSQYGVPLSDSGAFCSNSTQKCPTWGASLGGSKIPVLFTGNEFLNAILAYTSVILPVLNLNQEMANQNNYNQATGFISKAKTDGWIFAGAYFFNLVNLSGSALSSGQITDQNSGLENSLGPYDISLITESCNASTSPEGSLCWYFNNNNFIAVKYLNILNELIRGGESSSCGATLIVNKDNSQFSPTQGRAYIFSSKFGQDNVLGSPACSSTVYGFVGNSYFFNLKGQEGSTAISFKPTVNTVMATPFKFDWSTGCYGFMCIPGAVGKVISLILKGIFEAISVIVTSAFNALMIVMFFGPFEAVVIPLLQEAIGILGDFSTSPIVNLANMGADFIQTTFNAYVGMLATLGVYLAFPMIGIIIMVLTVFFMPFYMAWLAYFLGIGITTAYYVPILPYMIFIFGAVGWLFSVVESVIAAPIVALAVTTPEGEGFIGKGEQGLMILLNVFLRPSLMIIGFVTGIAVSYVSVWMLNASFSVGAQYLQMPVSNVRDISGVSSAYSSSSSFGLTWAKFPFAQTIGCVFYVVIYVSMYLTLVQKAFSLIYGIPDKILRWIGGHQENYGQETSQWVESTGQKVEDFSKKQAGAMTTSFGEVQKQIKGSSGGDGGGGGGGGQASGGGDTGGAPSGGAPPPSTTSAAPAGGGVPIVP